MNQAIIKYNKIDGNSEGGFKGSSTTLQEDIVAMITTTNKRKRNTDNKQQETKPSVTDNTKTEQKTPPFIKFTKVNNTPDSPLFKVGDTKLWNDKTWHYCDCPNHRGGIRWHTHPADACRTRACWLKMKEKDTKPNANIAEEPSTESTNEEIPVQDSNDATQDTKHSDVIGLLVAALNMTGDNELAEDLIADALNAIKDT